MVRVSGGVEFPDGACCFYYFDCVWLAGMAASNVGILSAFIFFCFYFGNRAFKYRSVASIGAFAPGTASVDWRKQRYRVRRSSFVSGVCWVGSACYRTFALLFPVL